MIDRVVLSTGALGCLLTAAIAGQAWAGQGSAPMRLDASMLDRVVAGATYGITGEAQATSDGSLGSSSTANLSLSANINGNGASASGSASAMGVGIGDNPQASSNANVQVSGPFDRVFRREIRRRFGGRLFQVDYSFVTVVAVKLPTTP
ncbi:MAG: hypothetical protein NZ555_13485 [Geminicoccaceae bacterium]|nr:hypothetical protein [Geminicoccaceae bacterium]MCX8102060.1 hypothetical protein [Geminicoccaceae bacterium]MDW8371179.1 hypothetical protein [Geminicoccaceae bacterium]